MKDLTLTPSQHRIILALIAGQSMSDYADENGREPKAVQQEIHTARKTTGLTTYQLVARVAADLVRLERAA
jgi:hypothetical protein